jgi:hypothetical protein
MSLTSIVVSSVNTSASLPNSTMEAPSHKNAALTLTVKDVLLVPKLGLNLLSCFRLAEKGVKSVFDKHECALIDTHNHYDILARANLRDNLYWISDMVVTPVPEIATPVSSETMSEDVTMWHNRLAHVNRRKISDMIRDKHLPPGAKLDVDKCTDCSSGNRRGTHSRAISTKLANRML